jgi:hypothetical protein
MKCSRLFLLEVIVLYHTFFFTIEFANAQVYFNLASGQEVSALPDAIEYGSGMSFYDFNNDGWDDLTFTMTDDSLVFYQNNQGNFERISSIVYGEGQVKQLLWVDYNNDSHLDFALSTHLGIYSLWRNDGNFNFTEASVSAGLAQVNERTYGISFADFNRDGFLDMYVAIYGPNGLGNTYATLNHLYRNDGDGTFTDVTIEAGVSDGYQSSFQGTWFDYDNDGWVDLFVINDRIFENSLYKNNGDGTFTDVSDIAGIGFAGEDPMTCTVGDFDNDGDLDVFLTNTDQGPSLLLVNNGDGTFSESADEHNVAFVVWCWGAVWADYNNDGLQDLYVSSGHWNDNIEENLFFVNHPDYIFSQEQDIFQNNHIARSFAPTRGDFDNNGYYDIAVLNEDPYDVFLWQNTGGSNNYVKITLQGTLSNYFAIGSWLRVYVDGQQYTQYTMCGENYVSQNSQHHIFGVGTATIIDSIQVEYSSGHIDFYYNLAVNQNYLLVEGDSYAAHVLAGSTSICQGQSTQLESGSHFEVTWNNGLTDSVITVSESGLYWFVAQNELGIISYSDTIFLEVNPIPVITVEVQHPLCHGDENGWIGLVNDLGTFPLQINWDNGMTGENLSMLSAGNYFFKYIDENSCTTNGIAQLLDPDELSVQVFTSPDNGGGDGSILLVINGGTPPYTVFLDGEEVETSITDLNFGTYYLTVSDFNICTFEENVNIDNLTNLLVSFGNEYQIYPNPAKAGSQVYIDDQTNDRTLELSLIDLSGRKIMDLTKTGNQKKRVEMNLVNCEAGIYLLKIASNGETKFFKLVLN